MREIRAKLNLFDSINKKYSFQLPLHLKTNMPKALKSFIISISIAVVALAALIYFLHSKDAKYDLISLLVGDVFLALISIFSFFIITKSLKNENPNAFIRAKYTGTLVKFFASIGLLVFYIFLNDRVVHKPTLFLFLGMFVVFSALEALPLARIAKSK